MEATKTKTSAKKKTSITKNIVQLRNGFINLPNAGKSNRGIAMSIVSELMQFGFMPSQDAIENLSAASADTLITFHDEVIAYLKKMTGSNRNYKPFWPGFPEQVMEMSELELWIHQLGHYWTNGHYVPNEWTKERGTAFEQPKYTNLVAGDEARFEKVFTDLVSVNNSLTPDDMEIIEWFVLSGSTLRFPDQIPFKENLCTLAAMGLEVPVRTVTDVLRIAVGMSGGDISLPKVPPAQVRTNAWSPAKSYNIKREEFKFKNFTRSERKIILNLLEKTSCDSSEAVLKDQRWVRLGERLHPGEYKARFPKSFKMFDAIRNQKVQSWYGKVQTAFSESFDNGLKVLSERPGEFMRRLDWLLRTTSTPSVKRKGKNILEKYTTEKSHVSVVSIEERQQSVLNTLKAIAPKVSNKVMYEVFNHFEGRYEAKTGRTIMVKGSRKRTVLPDLPAIAPEIIEAVQKVIIEALMGKFAKLPKFGKVYVDEKLKNIPMPTNMRSMNSSLKPRIRGQRVPMGNQNAKVIRAYVHWFDEKGTEDIDLSATFIGKGKMKQISFSTNHNCAEGCHSGDIIGRVGANAEYVDINIETTKKNGFKYVIIDVRNFRGRTLEQITDCVFGYMEREFPKSSKTFRPDTIVDCIRLNSPCPTTIVAMIDVETQEYVFLDIDAAGIPVASATFDKIMETIKPYMEAPKFSVYDLLLLHVNARGGELVEVTEKADTYFSFDDFASSYVETLKLMGV